MSFEIKVDILHFVKLLSISSIGSFHFPLDLGGPGRHDEQPDLPLEAGLLEVPFELRSPIDLDGPKSEGELAFHVFEEADRGEAGSLAVGSGTVPAAEGVSGAELEPSIVALQPEVERIHLDQVAWSIDVR